MKAANSSLEKAMLARFRRIRWLGALLGLLVLVMATGEVFLDWSELEQEAIENQGIYARVVEGQLATTLNLAQSNLRITRDALEQWMADADPVQSHRLLADAIRGQPVLRSLSMLDMDGRVLASSNPENVDAVISLGSVGGVPANFDAHIGPLFAARDLRQLSDGNSQPQGLVGLPMSMVARGKANSPLLLVAVLNPDRMASEHRLLIGEAAMRAAVVSFDGQMLWMGSDVPLLAGSRPATLPALRRIALDVEHDSYIDTGLDGLRAVGAFRKLSGWPLVVVAERAYATVLDKLLGQAIWIAAAAFFSWACIAIGFVLVRRGHANEMLAHKRVAELLGKVAESEQRWQFALEGAGDGIWDWNLVTGEFHHSARASTMLGYADGEIGARQEDWAALIHPEDASRVREAREAHLQGRAALVHEEMRVRSKDGQWKQILTRGMVTPQRDESGRPVRMTGTLTDVTDQRGAEAALALSQARRQAVLQSSLDAIITFDEMACIVDFNAAAESMFARRSADVLQQPIHELLLPPEQREAFMHYIRRFASDAGSPMLNRRLEAMATRADGSPFPIEFSIVPVNAGGQQWFTATMQDISERKRVELALKDSEARALNTFEQAAVGVLQQGADRRFLRVNQTLCKLLQYSQEELMGMNPDDLVHPDDAGLGAEGLRRLSTTGIKSDVQEKRIRRKDGQYVWVRLTASIGRDSPDHPIYVIGIVEDIQAQKVAQRGLEEARKRETHFATRIQQELLVTPAKSPLAGLWLSSFTHPSEAFDGDFFEVLQPGTHCIDLIAGDVMGKGVNAALMGAAVKMQLGRSLIELMTKGAGGSSCLPGPARILAAVHDAMTSHLQALDAFVTLCYVRIDRHAGTLTWAGCGHEEPVVRRADGTTIVLQNQQPPLGVLSEASFQQNTIDVGRGTTLLMHSDGVSDAVRAGGEHVGSARVRQTFLRLAPPHDAPGALLHLLRQEVLHGTTLSDDTTLLIARVCEPEDGVRLELACDTSSVPLVRRFVEAEARATLLCEIDQGLFALAVTEVFTNIVRHGQGLIEGAPIEVFSHRSKDSLVIELVHVGSRFDPPAERAPTRFDTFPDGGFGMEIVDEACDDVHYAHDRGVNSTRLTIDVRRSRKHRPIPSI